MKSASVYDVQHHFSRILRSVTKGETVVISHHRVPVAKLVPLRGESSSVPMPDFLARMKKDFSGKILSNSEPLLEEMRSERF